MGLEVKGSEAQPWSWNVFEQSVQQLRTEYKNPRTEKSVADYTSWIFRGQSDSNWALETTLERYLKDEKNLHAEHYALKEYYRTLNKIIPKINSLMNCSFEPINLSLFDAKDDKETKLDFSFGRLPEINLLSFLRHLGFPSLILDWTNSYYVAAFFAFMNAKRGKNVAIYAYQDWSGKSRGGSVKNAIIHEQNKYVTAHRRHYSQQGTYTVSIAEAENGTPIIKNHEKAVEQNPKAHNMKKYILDGEQREEIIEKLYNMNINDFTLFGDDDSLMKAMAYEHFILQN